MLHPWIIEQIRRREEEERRQRERPQLEVPVYDERDRLQRPDDEPANPEGEKAPERGVVIIDFAV